MNVSVVHGDLPEGAAREMSARGKDLGPGPHQFFAAGKGTDGLLFAV